MQVLRNNWSTDLKIVIRADNAEGRRLPLLAPRPDNSLDLNEVIGPPNLIDAHAIAPVERNR